MSNCFCRVKKAKTIVLKPGQKVCVKCKKHRKHRKSHCFR